MITWREHGFDPPAGIVINTFEFEFEFESIRM